MLTDFNLDNERNSIVISKPIDLFLQEIDLLLNTPRTSVLGQPELGVSLYSLIYEYSLQEQQLKSIIYQQIDTYSYWKQFFSFSIEIKWFKGSIRDIAQIEIQIIDENEDQIKREIVIR